MEIKDTEICKNCKNIVFGKGNPEAEILFVGEAPGKNQDEQGLPFVRPQGKILINFLEKSWDLVLRISMLQIFFSAVPLLEILFQRKLKCILPIL